MPRDTTKDKVDGKEESKVGELKFPPGRPPASKVYQFAYIQTGLTVMQKVDKELSYLEMIFVLLAYYGLPKDMSEVFSILNIDVESSLSKYLLEFLSLNKDYFLNEMFPKDDIDKGISVPAVGIYAHDENKNELQNKEGVDARKLYKTLLLLQFEGMTNDKPHPGKIIWDNDVEFDHCHIYPDKDPKNLHLWYGNQTNKPLPTPN